MRYEVNATMAEPCWEAGLPKLAAAELVRQTTICKHPALSQRRLPYGAAGCRRPCFTAAINAPQLGKMFHRRARYSTVAEDVSLPRKRFCRHGKCCRPCSTATTNGPLLRKMFYRCERCSTLAKDVLLPWHLAAHCRSGQEQPRADRSSQESFCKP